MAAVLIQTPTGERGPMIRRHIDCRNSRRELRGKVVKVEASVLQCPADRTNGSDDLAFMRRAQPRDQLCKPCRQVSIATQRASVIRYHCVNI